MFVHDCLFKLFTGMLIATSLNYKFYTTRNGRDSCRPSIGSPLEEVKPEMADSLEGQMSDRCSAQRCWQQNRATPEILEKTRRPAGKNKTMLQWRFKQCTASKTETKETMCQQL